MQQLTLLDSKRRVLREPQPSTSREAFESVNAAEQERVLAFVRRAGSYGCTADEMEAQRGVGHGHQRFAELRRKGLIVRTDRKRQTRAGRMAYVFTAR